MIPTTVAPASMVPITPMVVDKERLEIIKSHVLFDGPSLSPAMPGQEWRTLPEVPSAEELNPDWTAPGVRERLQSNVMPNHVDTPWSSKDKYLETHYRLQREEAMTMLRYCIRLFREEPSMMDDEQTCVYTKVFVRGYMSTRLGAICRVQFSTERAGKKICWNQTRRLNPGSLVVLSTAKDKFATICKPAIIADAYVVGGLDQNPPTIQFHWVNPEDAVMDPMQELVMIQSRFGYFEAIRHTMIGLQQAASEDSPLDKYLVHACQDDKNSARIMRNPNLYYGPLIHHVKGEANMSMDQREKALYEARDRLASNANSNPALGHFPPEVSQFTTLDKSQLEAVRRICTKELAIVQGPPGTGKTFTSVQALQVLLQSQHIGENVIVVAAQTNHAVDQIMAHLIKDFRVVRLGGRTQNENIKKYSLYNLRFSHKKFKKDHEASAIESARTRNLKATQNLLQEIFPPGLLSHDLLYKEGLISEAQFKSFNDEDWEVDSAGGQPIDIIAQWLGDNIMEIDRNRYKDPSFDMAEDDDFAEDDARAYEKDLGDGDGIEDHEDEHRIRGIWIPITQQWTSFGSASSISANNRKKELARDNLWDVPPQFRGHIYRYWQRELLERRLPTFQRLIKDANRLSKNHKINGWVKDAEMIKQNSIEIIGCTTTGLTKYRGLIASLRPRTMLIEEAAETREANIMSALYPSLEQLILVGDHQQLAPSCDTPFLASHPYNLRVSMFERLVNLKMPFTILNVQRRMVPKLREVLNPFYPQLRDHATVAKQAPIPGMRVESFFFHHLWTEDTDEDMSKFNILEAEMIAYFVNYLMLNGTDRGKITVLTFYRGQQKKIKAECRKLAGAGRAAFSNVHTVDSYQGEENDIVILSLVRSQGQVGPHNTGFVADTNRGVVSISRARRGFYIFGNLLCLTGTAQAAKTWGPVYKVFLRQERLGSDSLLPVVCQKHGRTTYMSAPDDWVGAHGGCDQPCGQRLDCGHDCGRRCHPMEHSQLFCTQPCVKTLRCGHKCHELCGDTCRCDCPGFTGPSMLPGPNQYSAFNPAGRQPPREGGNRGDYRTSHQYKTQGPGHQRRHNSSNSHPSQIQHSQRHTPAGTDSTVAQHRRSRPGVPNAWNVYNAKQEDFKDMEALRAASASSSDLEICDKWKEVRLNKDGSRTSGSDSPLQSEAKNPNVGARAAFNGQEANTNEWESPSVADGGDDGFSTLIQFD